MPPFHLVTASCLAFCAGLAACSFDFREQSVELRHLAEADALELRLAYFGLAHGDAKPSEAARTLARIGGGGRRFVLGGWPFELDLDRPLEADAAEVPAFRDMHAWLQDMEVLDAGLFRDGDGDYGAWQVLRFPGATLGLGRLNAAIDEFVLSELKDAPLGDPQLAPRFRAAAEAGQRWVALADGALRISFPTSPRGNAGLLRDLADEESAPFVAPLSELAVEAGFATLTFEPSADGSIAFRFPKPKRKATVKLSAALAEVPGIDELVREPPDWVRALDAAR